jgi:hypothetical protein|tara:strand:+ start:683 stop:955 length:273 start_codon:yes stop_codon:yes gene_type:complete
MTQIQSVNFTKEEIALVAEIRAQKEKESVLNVHADNQTLVDDFRACLNSKNDKGNRSFKDVEFKALLSAILGCKVEILWTGRPYLVKPDF